MTHNVNVKFWHISLADKLRNGNEAVINLVVYAIIALNFNFITALTFTLW